MASGHLLDASCDHEFAWMDVDPFTETSNRRVEREGLQWHEPIRRPSFRTKELIENKHSPHSQREARWPDRLPQVAYQQGLKQLVQGLPWAHPATALNASGWPGGGRASAQRKNHQREIDKIAREVQIVLDQALTWAVGKRIPKAPSNSSSSNVADDGGRETGPSRPRSLVEQERAVKVAWSQFIRAIKAGVPGHVIRHLRRQLREASGKATEERAAYQRAKDKAMFTKISHGDLRYKPGWAWDYLRGLAKPSITKGLPMRMKDPTGRLLPREESPAAIAAFRREVSRNHSGDPIFDQVAMEQIRREEVHWVTANAAPGTFDHPPTREEIRAALKACPNGRAAGSDDIPYEAFTQGGEAAIDILFHLFERAYLWEVHPRDWDTGLIHLLYKKGCPHEPKNYRAVTLLSTAAKIYEGVLLARIQLVLTETQFLSPSQGGFRQGISIPESFYSLHTTLAHRRAQGLSTYALFVDFQTAFPLANKQLAWVRLAEAGVNGRLFRAVRELYHDVKSRVMHPDTEIWALIEIPQGLREGAKPSPVLFSLLINDLPVYLAHGGDEGWGEIGIIPPIFAGAPDSHNPLFADDTTILAPDADALRRVIRQMQSYARSRGLVINFDKCAIMVVHPKAYVRPVASPDFAGTCPVTGDDLPIPMVTSFKYLGIWIDDDLSMARHVRATRSAFWAAHSAAVNMGMRPDGLALGDRAQIWKSMVLPTILNGIHFLSPRQARALQLDVNKSLRSMSASTAHPLALAAEFGILQVEIYRLRATTNLFFTLQSTPAPTVASALYRAIHKERSGSRLHYLRPRSTKIQAHEFPRRILEDLTTLGLQEHFDAGPRVAELEVTREQDKKELENPRRGASLLFPYRAAWKSLVATKCREQAEVLLRREASPLGREGSRLAAYVADRFSVLVAPVHLDTPAPWLKWDLHYSAQHLLLALRTQGSILQCHAPPKRRRDTPYEELFCPLCIAKGRHELLDTVDHILHGCPTLSPQARRIQQAADHYTAKSPITHKKYSKAPPSQSLPRVTIGWYEISPAFRTLLLLGYLPTDKDGRSFTPWRQKKERWMEGLMQEIMQPMLELLERRRVSDVQLERRGLFTRA